VHGAAYGGGVGLVACCDIAIAADDAKFGLTETRLGLVPAVISPYVVGAIGAAPRAPAVPERGDLRRRQAHALGLVHLSVPAAELDAAVARQVELLLRAGPAAVYEAKRLVQKLSGLDADRLSTAGHRARRADRGPARLAGGPRGLVRVPREARTGLDPARGRRVEPMTGTPCSRPC
jgi:methylglutaconyl-CoA hydratase